MKVCKTAVVLGALVWFSANAAWSAEPREVLTTSQMLSSDATLGLAPNDAFTPSSGAAAPLEAFSGTLSLSEAPMTTEPATLKSTDILGKNPQIFPAVELIFFSEGNDLVPITQEVIRAGSLSGGTSYWDILVQPGKVWSEPEDNGWSRASFPFALVHSLEGETHNGVAMFLYKGEEVSGLRFQVVQQTSPYYVEDYFTAWGSAQAKFAKGEIADRATVAARFAKATAGAVALAPWSELAEKLGADVAGGFDSAIRPGELVADGLLVDGTFYLKSCPSAAGELAYCDRQRFGVWSVTKSAVTATALLRLAEKFGPEVYEAKFADYIPETKDLPGWKDVTFGHAIDMATGLGNGSETAEPNDIHDGELDETYPQWYEARSEQDKIEAIVRIAKVYSWGPGKVARYRDQDMFMLGVAMDRYLKAKEGPSASLWAMLEYEVFGPIGIVDAPINRTIEPEGEGHPVMAFGLYPTLSDLVRIAQLYQNGGAHDEKQILHKGKLEEIRASTSARGLPTGDAERPNYFHGFWIGNYAAAGGCAVHYPTMSGWGSNYVSLLPNGVTTIRLAKNWDGDASAAKLDSLFSVAEKIRPFCP